MLFRTERDRKLHTHCIDFSFLQWCVSPSFYEYDKGMSFNLSRSKYLFSNSVYLYLYFIIVVLCTFKS
uniref:Uncharacterized protein n=1 Tax=Lepeophtheirus salmonis TaxID=72036 RepID=A0A0K2ULF5_LEPSM